MIIFVLLTGFHLPEVVPEFQPELWSPSLGRVEYPPILDQTLQPDANLVGWLVFHSDMYSAMAISMALIEMMTARKSLKLPPK